MTLVLIILSWFLTSTWHFTICPWNVSSIGKLILRFNPSLQDSSGIEIFDELRYSNNHVSYQIKRMIRKKGRVKRQVQNSRNRRYKKNLNRAIKDLRLRLGKARSGQTFEKKWNWHFFNQLPILAFLMKIESRHLKLSIRRTVPLRDWSGYWWRNDMEKPEKCCPISYKQIFSLTAFARLQTHKKFEISKRPMSHQYTDVSDIYQIRN